MDASRPSAVCPRCGYDQSGEVTTWSDRCPVSGICPECGLKFEWGDIFHPARKNLWWSVEHAQAAKDRLARTWPTLRMMARPWVFWRSVDVSRRTQPRALLLWIVSVGVLSHLIAWAPVGVLARAEFYEIPLRRVPSSVLSGGGTGILDAAVTGLVFPWFLVHLGKFHTYGSFVVFLNNDICLWALPLGFGLTWCAVLGSMTVSRRVVKMRFGHLSRALLLQCGVLVFAVQLSRIPYSFRDRMPLFSALTLGSLALVCIWSVAWWGFACWIGWGIRSLRTIAVGTIAGLIGAMPAYTLALQTMAFLIRVL